MSDDALRELAEILRQRVRIIADTSYRDRDPDGHLEALKSVSEAIRDKHEALRPVLPARLQHFLERRSLDKALAFIEELDDRSPGQD